VKIKIDQYKFEIFMNEVEMEENLMGKEFAKIPS
jgi:hypothetical protein